MHLPRSRPTLLAAVVVLVAAVALAVTGAVVLWPRAAPVRETTVPPGTLQFGAAMVVDDLETASQWATLRADCAATAGLVPKALAGTPAGTRRAAAQAALTGYVSFCGRYTADIEAARAVDDAETVAEQSYRFTDSMRASDGTVYDCVREGVVAGSAANGGRAGSDEPLSCWTADRSRWPALARVVRFVAGLFEREARYDEVAGCAMPELADMCTADVTRDRLRAASLTVFADGLARGDIGVLFWLGRPPSVGVAERKAVDDADAEYVRLGRAHGFAEGSPTAHERDRMTQWAATIRAALVDP